MKVRITFEDGDCVQPEMVGVVFANIGEQKEFPEDCYGCAFESKCACFYGERFCDETGKFVVVTETKTKEEAK